MNQINVYILSTNETTFTLFILALLLVSYLPFYGEICRLVKSNTYSLSGVCELTKRLANPFFLAWIFIPIYCSVYRSVSLHWDNSIVAFTFGMFLNYLSWIFAPLLLTTAIHFCRLLTRSDSE